MKQTLPIAYLLLLCSVAASAQLSVGIQIGTLIDDNAFNNYLQIQDRLTEMSLQGAYDWETETSNTQLFYTGSLNYFTLLPARTFQVHDAGLVYTHLLGEDDETTLNAGGTLTVRANHDEFRIYDHTQVSFYGNLGGNLSDLVRVKGGYKFRSVAFTELNDFNYLEHSLFAQAAVSLPTKTSFILQTDLGLKKYASPNAVESDATPPQFGRSGRSSAVTTPGVTQLTGTFRFGQGITEKTGISLTGQYQVSLQKETRYLTSEDGILTDDELFDDHYGYEGPLGSLMFTQILPAGVRLRASGLVERRHYSNRPAFDLLGLQVAPQRVDTRSALSLSLGKTFPSVGLQASLAFDHIINGSNDAFYNYRNTTLSLQLSFTH